LKNFLSYLFNNILKNKTAVKKGNEFYNNYGNKSRMCRPAGHYTILEKSYMVFGRMRREKSLFNGLRTGPKPGFLREGSGGAPANLRESPVFTRGSPDLVRS